MAKPLRIEFPGAPYHVTPQAIGEGVFDDDRLLFLEALGRGDLADVSIG